MAEYKNIPIKELVLLENNPRTVTKTEMDKLCDSLINDPTFFNKWPENLTSGIMFFDGQRITKEEFEKEQK